MPEPSQHPSPGPIDAEIVPDPTPPAPPAPDYDEHGVPSLDYVREKIESRYATSIGAAEGPRAVRSGSRRRAAGLT